MKVKGAMFPAKRRRSSLDVRGRSFNVPADRSARTLDRDENPNGQG